MLIALACATPLAAERWRVQYFYDENKSTLTLADIKFPSARRGVAVGHLTEGNREKGVAVLTSDGGEHWQVAPLKEIPVSLFFLNENLGWMVTQKGIWETTEAGHNWRKLPGSPQGAFRVHFADEKHGWAVGMKKSLFETVDGGARWKPVPAASEPATRPEYTAYSWIAFASPLNGIVAGWSMPPQRGDAKLPDWVEPDKAIRRSERPHLSLTLETRDGGKTWNSSAASMFGRITRIRFSPRGDAIGLIEFAQSFQWPSEVFHIDWRTGRSERVYREKDRAVTDVWLTPSGTAYLAGTEVTGKLRNALPTKVKVLKSDDFGTWREMDVDYRAVATRAMLAAADEQSLWLATDTGMILKLEP